MSDEKAVSRRSLMMKIGILLNGAVALLIATPVVGYLLGPIRRNGGYNSWIDLGDVSQFALGQTRLASFVNPQSAPWDGATSKAACWVRRTQEQKFQIFAINCAHLGCPVRWFPQSELFMCPCHGGVYYAYKVQNGKLMINGGQMPTLSNSAAVRKGSSECTG
jgi:Rieske [2Fe-2S] domain